MGKLFAAVLLIIATVAVTLLITNDEAGINQETPAAQISDPDKAVSTSGDKLDYSNKGLSKFPSDVLSKSNVTQLDLSGNNLDGALPGEIRFLSKLEVLDVSDNNMTGIPAEIGQLSNLRVLNYANNSITGLPNELGNLSSLEIFDLSGNNPSQQDLDKIRSDLPPSVNIIL